MYILKMPGLSLEYSWVGWGRKGGWVETESYFQLLILHLCVVMYRLSQFTYQWT